MKRLRFTMVLTPPEIKKITSFIKKEPRTIQDIAHCIEKTWVTADSYVEKIKTQTGLINVKVFRPGTKGAIKVVYWNYGDAVEHDEIRKILADKIRLHRRKEDFDPLEIHHHLPEDKKRAFIEKYDDPSHSTRQDIFQFLQQAEHELYSFSGNISWINMQEEGIPIISIVEQLLQRGVMIRILCRVDLASLENLRLLNTLIRKYPDKLEIRHALHPLRGFIVDQKIVRLKDEKKKELYKQGELKSDVRVFYEWKDTEWVEWLTHVFWNIYRNAPTAEQRLQEIEKIF
ncbi:MAG: hypothetical protein Q8R37_02575 [Nanoarchaeota archaeon]|nr:hypothetical protein [Nanoarchaeota archaeon]